MALNLQVNACALSGPSELISTHPNCKPIVGQVLIFKYSSDPSVRQNNYDSPNILKSVKNFEKQKLQGYYCYWTVCIQYVAFSMN